MDSSSWDGNTLGYSTVESLLEEVSNNMAASNLSRLSRGQGNQKTSGCMRVVKPGSSSNSPRNSIRLGRRMTDGAYRRRLAMMDPNALGSRPSMPADGLQPQCQTARPVSWHPASHLPSAAPAQPLYPHAFADTNASFQMFDFPPTPAVYSGYTSPASAFSPLSMPYNGYEQQQLAPRTRPHSYNPQLDYTMPPQPALEQPAHMFTAPSTTNIDPSMYSHFDWSNFATNGFEDSTAPPTPENFLPIQHPDPTFPAEDTIPYHALDDGEDSGEELVGMGLYDSPEVVKSPASDPYLDNYRSLMMSQLLGTAYRKPEATGKGLKLEETWNPPASDDGEDEEEDDDEQDGEGEDDDEPAAAAPDAGKGNPVAGLPAQQNDEKKLGAGSSMRAENVTQSAFVVQRHDGWL